MPDKQQLLDKLNKIKQDLEPALNRAIQKQKSLTQ